MIKADSFLEEARSRGFVLWTGVPCSYLKPFINYVIGCKDLRYVGAANEGDAVAIAAGAGLGGWGSVVMLQNSGLGNAVNPLTSLTYTFRIPILLIVTLRGDPSGPPDEPQHELMGSITTRLLETMRISWEYFPTDETSTPGVFDRIASHFRDSKLPYALVMRKGSVADWQSTEKLPLRSRLARPQESGDNGVPLTRLEVLRAVKEAASSKDIIVATTGYTGRELYSLGDPKNQFYLVGSMGCASSFGLGLALARSKQNRVVVIDGDGALLMRLGAMATIGYQRPENLVHIVLDNGQHESTGGQSTVAGSIDFVAIAGACGYAKSYECSTAQGLGRILNTPEGALTFVHVRTLPGSVGKLPRPKVAPHEVADRLRTFLLSE